MKPIRIVAPPLAANCYLLLDEKKALIDVGGDIQFIINAVSRYISPKELDYVILTHSHYDHAAAAGHFKSIAKIAIHRDEYSLIKAQGFTSFMFGVSFKPFEPDIMLEGGERIELGETNLEVIHTPGHSPGSICLYEPEKKWLFSGDTVFAHGSFGRVDLPGGSARELIKSLEMLSKLDVENMYPGHEDVVEGNASRHIANSLRIAKMFL
ncbi:MULTISPECIES: MBL fold metallo-hydrolase [unclassified Archaeoglobus]|jgi:glyoxylase-like metal-dependent hydrolase (beta-lactamase superfamily II)|uniref:MBL fold metallo-hydrolase n=1 Tax=unclassified Archaeoglobus TaxID=2643606 RepID=UPI0025BE7CA1|nr:MULTISPECIES: MBL fold metallo-hydrolase [unclassified Archaeoglobus]